MKRLIIAPAWIGDMIMAQSLFIYLKHRHPDDVIDVVAPSSTYPLLSRMPEVRRAILLPVRHGEIKLLTRKKLGVALRTEHYTQAILLTNSFKSALIPWFARIPQRTGFRGELRLGLVNDTRTFNPEQHRLMIERFLLLGLARDEVLPAVLPSPRLQVDPVALQQVLESFKLSINTKIIALCPGAEYGPAKRWPAEYYAAVARYFIQKGLQVWIFGGPHDVAIAEEITTQSAAINLAGRTSLLAAIDLLSCVDAVVTNDSGLMHMAAALDKPIIALYGSSSPTFTPPLTKHARILSLHLSCSPCFKRVCPLQHLNCLKQLYPEQVIKALESLCEF